MEAVRGTSPTMIVSFACDGQADPFLLGVKIDGRYFALREVRSDSYARTVSVDLGPWNESDGDWHTVDVVLDPMNLFKETDESNNRVSAQVRMIEPDVGVHPPLCGFRLTEEAGPSAGNWVEQVPVGTPVNVTLWAALGGPYPALRLRAQSGVRFDTTAVFDASTCASSAGGPPSLYKRWLPPGPGAYDVVFSVTPPEGMMDRDRMNNVVIKRLTVFPVARAAR